MNFLKINLSVNNDWITIVFLLIFVLLGAAKIIYKERLFELVVLFFSKKYLLKYAKENQLIFNGFSVILYLVQVLVLSLIFFVFAQEYLSLIEIDYNYYFFIKILIGVSLFFLFRFLIGFALGELFGTKQQQQQLAFTKISYLFSISILILPFLLLVFFIKKYNFLAFQLLIFVFAILLIIRYVFVFKNNNITLAKQGSNFFLYLCALEIAPLMLILKTISEM